MSRRRVTGTVVARQMFGGPFRRVRLALYHALQTLRLWQHVEGEDFPTLPEVLEDTRPQHLRLSTTLFDVPQLTHCASSSPPTYRRAST